MDFFRSFNYTSMRLLRGACPEHHGVLSRGYLSYPLRFFANAQNDRWWRARNDRYGN
jgi:hypothetical protein